MEQKKIIIYSDGGARGNPGPAAAGAVLLAADGVTVIDTISVFLGEATNNQAEYRAIELALARALELKANIVECYLDSELVVQQLNLKYKVKNQGLGPFFLKTWNLAQRFQKATFIAIPRENNRTADRLVNRALDQQLKKTP